MDVMKKTAKLRGITLLLGSLLLAGQVYASEVHTQSDGFTGNSTPTKYVLTISAIEFHRVGDNDATYHTVVSTTADWDIASANPGATLGSMSLTTSLPAGTYDKIRFTVSKTMTVQASIASLQDGSPCRTESNVETVSNPFGAGELNIAYLGVRDGGAAEPEVVTMPSGSDTEPSPDFTDLGSTFRGSLVLSQPFTVSGGTIPTIKLKFDVTNSVQFTPLQDGSGRCVVFPGPPSMSVEVD